MNPRRLLSQAALIIGALFFSAGLQAFAFTAPSTAPPNADAYAPLSTSPTAQSKQGGLLLNTGGATNGLIVQSGNVGIGTASPSQQLDVAGYVRSATGLCIGSDCRTSWPTTTFTETDPTVQSWAKTTSPSIPGNVTIGGNLQVSGPVGMGYEIKTAQISRGSGVAVTASCSSGKVILGGGCSDDYAFPGGPSIAQSFPNGTSGWYCAVQNSSTAINSTLTAYAICANAN
ncbi:MAG: hypothetical protein KGH56_03800 [Patescibacteria group bacterium]|nr:hypothetical protein [Patescibacteria group bacterium]